MKTAPLVFAFLALAAVPALPTGPTADAMTISCSDKYVRLAGHHEPADARVAITSQNGKVTLLLTNKVVAFQLSERVVHKVRQELRDKKEDQDNWFAAAIVTTVAATVGELIDNSVECRIRDLRDVSYEDGRLVFLARDGKYIFDDVDVDDTDVASSFSARDARKFVREFERVKFSGQ